MTFCFNCTVLINKYKRIITQSPDIQVIIITSKSLNLVVNNQVCITGLGAYLQPAIYTFCRPAQEIVCYRLWALQTRGLVVPAKLTAWTLLAKPWLSSEWWHSAFDDHHLHVRGYIRYMSCLVSKRHPDRGTVPYSGWL